MPTTRKVVSLNREAREALQDATWALPEKATHSTRVLHLCGELRRLEAELALGRQSPAATLQDRVTKADLLHALERHRYRLLADLAG